ncbi:GntR family transcriptional regulator [Rhodococcus pyridinivorans]|nr:GntR family transcriptional regulator [Rhodococcus pyridinivorans]
MVFSDSQGHFAPFGDAEANQIYTRMYESVLEHRLRPGTRLPEERLAAVFGVSRAKVRKVLARFEHEQLIEVQPNRGAQVAEPTVEQSADTLEARRVIEPAIMRALAERATQESIELLRKHTESEYDAVARRDKHSIIRLAGEFHNLAADLAGNSALARTMRELSALTCLTILLYNAPTAAACLPDDHVHITDAIEAGDGSRAAELMLRHLEEVEKSLVFAPTIEEPDLEEIFGLTKTHGKGA